MARLFVLTKKYYPVSERPFKVPSYNTKIYDILHLTIAHCPGFELVELKLILHKVGPIFVCFLNFRSQPP